MAMDLARPFPESTDGNVFLLMVIDVCMCFMFLKPIHDKQAITVGKALFDLFCLIGFPRILQSDNGAEFVNSLLATMTTQLGVNHCLLTPYHPCGNGVAE